MPEPVSIKLFLVTGEPDGLRTAELSNWSGKAIAFSRAEVNSLVARGEAGQSGVYLLIGKGDGLDKPLLYIGEAEDIGKRIKQHRQKRDNWFQAIAFVSKDENLTKAHIRYLERRLIEIARSANKADVENDQLTNSKLPESDLAEMEGFLSRVLQLLPMLGCGFFKSALPSEEKSASLLYCKLKGLVAKGLPTDEGFAVYSGSQAVLNSRSGSATNIMKRRELLVETGVLIPVDDHLVFSQDYFFTSPSYGASVVCGGNTNGLTAWKDESGKTLKELES